MYDDDDDIQIFAQGGLPPNLTGQPILKLSRSPRTAISITKPLLNFFHPNPPPQGLYPKIEDGEDNDDDDDYYGNHSDQSTWPNEQSWSLVTHYGRCRYSGQHQIPVILSDSSDLLDL